MSSISLLRALTTAAFLSAAPLMTAATQSMAQDAEVEVLPKPETSPMTRVSDLRSDQNEADGDAGSRVFGGDEAKKGEFPFQVALLSAEKLDNTPQSQSNAQFCGGSLIAPNWVLTAAHCLHQDGAVIAPDSVIVLTGATNLMEGERHTVAEVIVNDGYSERTLDNDVGLLRLAQPSNAATIKIATERVPDTGTSMVTGWGRMDDGTFPNDLMKASLDLEPNNACNDGIKAIYARDLSVALRELSGRMRYNEEGVTEATALIAKFMSNPLTDNMICSGTKSGKRDACNGDSGGPLFTIGNNGPSQVGIVSWGEGPFDAEAACGHANAYGVYTRLGNYVSWVNSKMAEASPAPAVPVAPPAVQEPSAPGTMTKPKP